VKIADYYDKTAASDAFLLSMSKCKFLVVWQRTDHLYCPVLHPEMKLKHFTKYWSADLQQDVRDTIEKLVSCRFFLSLHLQF